MSIKVYSKSGCVQCTATCRALDQKGLVYSVVDIARDEEAYALVRSLGYMQVPVVVTEDAHWAGFQPDRINSLVREKIAA